MSLKKLLASDRYSRTIIVEALRDSETVAELHHTLHEEFPDEDAYELMAEIEMKNKSWAESMRRITGGL